MKTVLVFFLFLLFNVGFTQTPFWRDTNGPYCGNILFVASDSGNYILGSDYNSVLRSSNGGNSWERVLAPASSSFVISDNLAFSAAAGSIYRSTDDGLTWTNVYSFSSLYQDSYFNSLCITSERYILANIYGGGILLSTDAGDTWSFCKGRPSYSIRVLASDDHNRVYAASGGNIFISTNTGISWAQQNSVPISSSINSLIIDKQGIIFAGSDSGGVYKSIDNGQSWSSVNNGLANTYVRTIHETHSGYLYAGTSGGGLYRTTDSGVHWFRCSKGLSSVYINTVSSDDHGDVFIGSPDGFYRSIDEGVSWKQINSGLVNAYTECIGFDSLGNVYAGTDYCLFQYSKGNNDWVQNTLGGGFVRSVVFGTNGIGFATKDGGVYRTTDGGQTWSRSNSFSIFNYSVIINPSGFIFAGIYTGLIRSKDSGLNWSKVGEGIIDGSVFCLSYSGQYIFAGSFNGCIFRSEDQGDTWVKIQTGSSNSTVFGISIHPNGHIFASTYLGGILRSTNNGDSWSCVGFQNTFTELAINANGVLFVGSGNGVFQSSDEGATWIPTNSGLTNLSVRSIGIDSHGYVFIGTNEGAVFSSIQSTTSVDQPINALPCRLFLYQNFPNPFNPITLISYEVPKVSKVRVTVFDILGRQVATLVDRVQQAGKQQITFDGLGIPSGVYFYRLQIGTNVETKKMMLIR